MAKVIEQNMKRVQDRNLELFQENDEFMTMFKDDLARAESIDRMMTMSKMGSMSPAMSFRRGVNSPLSQRM